MGFEVGCYSGPKEPDHWAARRQSGVVEQGRGTIGLQ